MTDEQKRQREVNYPESEAESKPPKFDESEMRGRGKRRAMRESSRPSRRKGGQP